MQVNVYVMQGNQKPIPYDRGLLLEVECFSTVRPVSYDPSMNVRRFFDRPRNEFGRKRVVDGRAGTDGPVAVFSGGQWERSLPLGGFVCKYIIKK